MRTRIWFTIAGLAVLVSATACSGDEAATATTEAAAPTTTSALAPLEITIDGFAFDPADVTVPAGTTVTFVNRDGTTHTTTSADGGWDSGPLPDGGSFTVTLGTPGVFAYLCTIHPSMKGTIRVES